MSKIREWISRYLPAEIAAIIGAVVGGLLTNFLFNNPFITAFGATWGENVGYYGKFILNDFKQRKPIIKFFRDLLIEFGPGEYLDSFVIRPFTMYFFPKVTGNLALGLFFGKISADVIFYFFTIPGYEFIKKYIKD
jgi:hypothetical protein